MSIRCPHKIWSMCLLVAVLPKFEVLIDAPDVIYREDPLEGSVTAKWDLALIQFVCERSCSSGLFMIFPSTGTLTGSPFRDTWIWHSFIAFTVLSSFTMRTERFVCQWNHCVIIPLIFSCTVIIIGSPTIWICLFPLFKLLK